jgi:hypothetical protein
VGYGPDIRLSSEGQTGWVRAAIGDRVGFAITAESASYVTLIALNADGTITGAGLKDRRLNAGETWRIDGVLVTGPPGLSVLMTIAAPFALDITLPQSPEECRKRRTEKVVEEILVSLRSSVNPQGIAVENAQGNSFASLVGSGNTAPLSVYGWSTALLYQRT